MKYTIFCLSLMCFSFCSYAQRQSLNYFLQQVSEDSLKKIEKTIAGETFQGRMAASRGDSLTIQFIGNLYKTYHLSNPFKFSNPYLQNVPLSHSDYSTSKLLVQKKEYIEDNQWHNFDNINNLKTITAEVVFIGYGISIPKFDELKDVDIRGKFVLMNWGSPKDGSDKDVIESKDMPSDKEIGKSIRIKKPLGMLVYEPDFTNILRQINDFGSFEPYFDYSSHNTASITGAMISPELSSLILGLKVDSIYSRIGNSGKPHSFNTHKLVTLSIVRNDRRTSTKNIIGLIMGTDTASACVILSAHHDHFGKIRDKTYFGADDNGSGTTALLEIARILGNAAKKGIRPKRTIVFLSTGAEEQGLIGGYYYTNNPVIPLTKTYCNINIDMVGRVDSFHVGTNRDSNYVYCLYHDTSNNVFNTSKLETLNNACCNLVLDTLYDRKSKKINEGGLITRSDNFPFIKKGIPAIFLFGGFHIDYHQPTDTMDKINYPLLIHRTQLAMTILWQLANE